MKNVVVPFFAPIPVRHRVRGHKAEQRLDVGDGKKEWFSAGSSLLLDLDTGIVYGAPTEIGKLRRAPGPPTPSDPERRLLSAFEGTVAWCLVTSSAGESGVMETDLGIEEERTGYR